MSFYEDFSVPTMLATQGQLSAWIQDVAPLNAQVLLREASSLVLDATLMAYYDADPTTGLPTDQQIIQAMQDATCIQAATWNAIGYNPLLGGVIIPNVASATKIDTASVTYADAALAAQSQADAVNALCPAAIRRLQLNNLIVPTPWTYG